MNEEIKEILESLDKIAKSEYYPEDLLYYENCKILLDYITNLQQIEQEHKKLNAELRQENSNLKTALDESQEVLADYKQENKRLKKYLDDKMKDLQNIYTSYISLQNTYEDLYDKYIDIAEGRNENE